MLRGPRNVRPRDMQTSKLLSGLYMIKVGAKGHILKSIKDRLRLLFQAIDGHRSDTRQMMKDVSRISIFPVWFSPHLVFQHIDKVPAEV
jgi:hypothetical protein